MALIESDNLKSFKLLSSEENSLENTTAKVLSLFSGGGGMDLGLEGGFYTYHRSINTDVFPNYIIKRKGEYSLLKRSIFKTVFANDIFESAKNNWLNYFIDRGVSPDIYHDDSIVDLVKLHRNGIHVFPDNIDVVTGGFPCQDFSLSGKRKGFKSNKSHLGVISSNNNPSVESRGQLYIWMKEVIEITRPKLFIAENVKGMASLGDILQVIKNDFESAGYLVFAKLLHAADYGVPQSRERIIFIGINLDYLNRSVLKDLLNKKVESEFYPFPRETHNYTSGNSNLWEYVRLNEVFNELNEPDNTDDLSQKYYSKAKFMGKHCQGQSEVKLNDIGPTIRSEHHGNIEFRRLSKLNGGKNYLELGAGLKERRLTVRECALIQTFPPDYEFVVPHPILKGKFVVSPSEAYKVIGNAVPPVLAFHIGQRVESLWKSYFN